MKLLTVKEAEEKVQNSINSAEDWMDTTNNVFNTDERVASLEELLDVIMELEWRYGNSVRFVFCKKSKIIGTIPITEVMINPVPEPWDHRILVNETKQETPVIYIKF